MQDQQYYKDGTARVIELLKESFGEYFRAYFDGEPEDIPESMLPCLSVKEKTGVIEPSATGTDDMLEVIQITIMLNKKDDIGATDDINTDLTEYRLRKIIKGQHPDTKEYLPNTILYALRRHYTLNDAVVQNRIEIDYDVNIRGDNTLTAEAYVTLSVIRKAIVPVRD